MESATQSASSASAVSIRSLDDFVLALQERLPRIIPAGSGQRKFRYWKCSLQNRGCPFFARVTAEQECGYVLAVSRDHDVSVHEHVEALESEKKRMSVQCRSMP